VRQSQNLLSHSTKVHLGSTYRTILPWMAQDTQYWSFRYILGTVYSGNTEASEISPAHCQSSTPSIRYSWLLVVTRVVWRLKRTNGGRLDHVADGESLDRLVLGCASRAVGAADGLDVATTLLVTTLTRSQYLSHIQFAHKSYVPLDERFLTILNVYFGLVSGNFEDVGIGVGRGSAVGWSKLKRACGI
jgi:hypothetical protein